MHVRIKPNTASLLIFVLGRIVSATMRWQVMHLDRIDKAKEEIGKGVILACWHGKTFIPINYFRRYGLWSMISTSRDGEYQAHIFKRFGFNIVRGSSSARGAVQATLTLVKQIKNGSVVAHTPDGPRGPSGCAQPGIIFMAVKSGCPILPFGISAYPRKLLPTWDHYLIPYPFARAVMICGEPIYIPPDATTPEEQEKWAKIIGDKLLELDREADRLAGAKVEETASNKAEQWRQA